MKKRFLFIILLSFIFSFFFSLEFFFLAYKNFTENDLILYPSVTSDFIFEARDYDDIFIWIKQSKDNFSIFNLSAKVYELKNNLYHFNASRGLSYFIPGIFLYLFNEPIYFTLLVCFFFLFINYFIIFFSFGIYTKNFFLCFLLTNLTLLFSSKLIGGVLNFYHLFEYFFDFNNFFSSTNLKRIPNVLINNIVIFSNFILLKKSFKNCYKNYYFHPINLIITTFISPIIFLVFISCNFLSLSLLFIKKKIFLKKYLFFILFYFILSFSLIFHFYNLSIINDGSLLSEQWTGNYLYDLEMFSLPLVIFFLFYKYFKNYFPEFFVLLSSLIIYFFSYFFIDVYLASKICEEFLFLYAFLSLLFFYNLINKIKFSKIVYLKFILLFLLNIVYILTKKEHHFIFQYILFIVICFFLLNLIKKKNFSFSNPIKICSIITFCILIYFSFSSSKLKIKEFDYFPQYEESQKSFFKWLVTNNKESVLLSFNIGLMKNATLHTNNYIYLPNITVTNLDQYHYFNRFFDIAYLYGFDAKDLQEYLKDFKTNQQLNSNDFRNPIIKNKSIIIASLFHGLYQTNFNKDLVLDTIVTKYEHYLNNKYYLNVKKFDLCVITFVDLQLIKNNSYMHNLILKENPIFTNSILDAYYCANPK
jgi:hypothetical protein